MPNIHAIRRRHDELLAQIRTQTRALEDDHIDVKTFQAFWVPAEAEMEQLRSQIKGYEHAMSYRTGKLDPVAAAQWSDGDLSAVSGTEGNRLSFKGLGRKAADAIIGSDIHTKASGNTKAAPALAPSGATVVAQDFEPSVVTLGMPAQSLLDVLPVKPHDTSQFAYLRQTVRDNQAAIVPEMATKPTSTYSVERVEDQLDVVAHISERVPRMWFYNNELLQGFVQSELDYGLRVAVEEMVLSDVKGTSGIQTQAFSSSMVVTLRKSLTKLEANGLDPSAIVVNPVDWATVELALASTNAIDFQGIPYDAAARRLFGVPVAVSSVRFDAGMEAGG